VRDEEALTIVCVSYLEWECASTICGEPDYELLVDGQYNGPEVRLNGSGWELPDEPENLDGTNLAWENAAEAGVDLLWEESSG